MSTDDGPGVDGTPRVLLRLEGAALAFAAVLLYPRTGESWWLFAALILAPDIGMLGYVVGSRLGAVTYNTLHVTALPVVFGLVGLLARSPLMLAIALIWLAHIGFDRMLGYGLKYGTRFTDTHLGRIGGAASPKR